MAKTMMKLGAFTFSLDTAAYKQLQRTTAYKWAAQDRAGQSAALQFLGEGEDAITLTGSVYPHYKGGLRQVDSMRAEAAKGEPLILVDGMGWVLGKWVILTVSETKKVLFDDGAPRKIDFSLKLRKYSETVQ